MHLKTMDDLFMQEMKGLYSAEQMLTTELPNLANQASNESLKQKLQDYAADACNQMLKFQEAFHKLGHMAEAEECKGMEGIIEQANDVVGHIGDPSVKDAAIIAEVQKMKHYEIAGYGTARTYADMLGKQDVANMLASTLHDEEHIDRELTELAMDTVNPQALAA